MRQNRQWEKVLWGVLILSAVFLGLLLVVQISEVVWDNKEDSEQTQETETTEEETSQEKSQTSEEYTTVEETESFREDEQGYIIIGDSHTVVTDGQGYSVYGSGIEGISLNKNLFIVHTGLDPVMGTIEWLEGDGTKRMEEIIAEHTEISRWNIISMHGTSMVTVPGIAEQYIKDYEDWMNDTFRNHHVYIVSVPPLDEAEWKVRHPDMPIRLNQDIIMFNTKIKEAFPDHYFDYYDWFLEHHDFQDEIHYTGKTYCEMFDEIIAQIEQRNN